MTREHQYSAGGVSHAQPFSLPACLSRMAKRNADRPEQHTPTPSELLWCLLPGVFDMRFGDCVSTESD
jgi:hypothetical protein